MAEQIVDISYGKQEPFDADTDLQLSLALNPTSLQSEWNRCHITSGFLSDYFRDDTLRHPQHGILNTVINELLENAVKYSQKQNSDPIYLTLQQNRNRFRIETKSVCSLSDASNFDRYLARFFTQDIEELYIETLTSEPKQAIDSQMGLITLKKDYGANISCQISPASTPNHLHETTVIVILDVKEVDN